MTITQRKTPLTLFRTYLQSPLPYTDGHVASTEITKTFWNSNLHLPFVIWAVYSWLLDCASISIAHFLDDWHCWLLISSSFCSAFYHKPQYVQNEIANSFFSVDSILRVFKQYWQVVYIFQQFIHRWNMVSHAWECCQNGQELLLMNLLSLLCNYSIPLISLAPSALYKLISFA